MNKVERKENGDDDEVPSQPLLKKKTENIDPHPRRRVRARRGALGASHGALLGP